MDFKVASVMQGKTAVVFVQPLQEGKVELSERPSLGGKPIKKTFSRLRSTNTDGTPRPGLFGFQLVNATDLGEFKVGDRVTLG